MTGVIFSFSAQLKESEIICHEKTSAQKSIIGKGGVKSSRMSFFRGVKVRVNEKWTWGEGGSKKAENAWTYFFHGSQMKGWNYNLSEKKFILSWDIKPFLARHSRMKFNLTKRDTLKRAQLILDGIKRAALGLRLNRYYYSTAVV